MTDTCSYCDKKATKRMTPDLDIYGILLCDDESCKDKLYLELWVGLQ